MNELLSVFEEAFTPEQQRSLFAAAKADKLTAMAFRVVCGDGKTRSCPVAFVSGVPYARGITRGGADFLEHPRDRACLRFETEFDKEAIRRRGDCLGPYPAVAAAIINDLEAMVQARLKAGEQLQ